MKSEVNILLVILLVIVSTDYALSASCYTCNPCPIPFDASSHLVRNESGCVWCAKISVGESTIPIRECQSACGFEVWRKRYNQFSYSCCTRDYCNTSLRSCSAHQILLVVISIVVSSYIYKKQ
ncbi:unnamed protein product [Heterobilharzia americana]|nr:unnamed protein product [Heterobilharzia americana]CAH8465962.1 unnamed protein product [Heterobilharzia americana]